MLRTLWKDRISNEIALHRKQGQRILTKTINERKLNYFGHLVRQRDLQEVLIERKVAGKGEEVDLKRLGQTASVAGKV